MLNQPHGCGRCLQYGIAFPPHPIAPRGERFCDSVLLGLTILCSCQLCRGRAMLDSKEATYWPCYTPVSCLPHSVAFTSTTRGARQRWSWYQCRLRALFLCLNSIQNFPEEGKNRRKEASKARKKETRPRVVKVGRNESKWGEVGQRW